MVAQRRKEILGIEKSKLFQCLALWLKDHVLIYHAKKSLLIQSCRKSLLDLYTVFSGCIPTKRGQIKSTPKNSVLEFPYQLNCNNKIWHCNIYLIISQNATWHYILHVINLLTSVILLNPFLANVENVLTYLYTPIVHLQQTQSQITQRSLSYRNHSIDLLSTSMDWFLYDRDLCHERVNSYNYNKKKHQFSF